MSPRRLYRCRHDRQLAGVAAGMAEYLEIDPTVVRILWILSAFVGGFTIVLYIILAFVVPLEPASMPGPVSRQAAGPAEGVSRTDVVGTEPTGEASGSVGDPADGSPPVGRAANSEWTAPAPTQPSDERRRGRRLYFGVLLVAFGAIAMASVLVPGWVGSAVLGPAFILALGVALLVGSARRTASAQ